MANFLPKAKKLPGIDAVYHYTRPDKGNECTVINWRDRESLVSYREGDLIKEAIAFELKHGLKISRESHLAIIAL